MKNTKKHTLIIKLNQKNPEISRIKTAAKIIANGGTVGFPTETVYGLGANALDSKAIKKIFEAKGRPSDNPLIVHIADRNEVYRLAKKISKEAELLMDAFWPGPLTIILERKKIVPKETTAGLNTVAIRMPKNRVALELIKLSGVPIAAPSANTSGKPSPTKGEHVILDLNGKVDAIIVCGIANIGVESTVVDMTVKPPILLRPGRITLEQLKKVLGKVSSAKSIAGDSVESKPRSPGMKYQHYAPNAIIILVEGKSEPVRIKIQELLNAYKKQNKKTGVMTNHKLAKHMYNADLVKFVGSSQNSFAKNLFNTLREFDSEEINIIFAEGTSDKKLGLAIMNRLRRAASRIIKV